MAILKFSSFYDMKEWLMKGEYTLPSLYTLENNGKVYVDYAISFDSEEMSNRADSIKGITKNSKGEISKVLCTIMNNHFVRTLDNPITDMDGNEHDALNKNIFTLNDNDYDAVQGIPEGNPSKNPAMEDGPTYSFNEFSNYTHYGKIDGSNANTIAPDTFAGSNITEIIIPEGITHISNRAFHACYKLRKVIFPSTLVYIGKKAFCNCESLTEVHFPPSLRLIDSSAFLACKNLKTVSFGNGIIRINRKAFCGTGLIKLVLPNSLYAVDRKAFAHCENLEKVWIGGNVGNRDVEIAYDAFEMHYEFEVNGATKRQNNVLHPTAFYGSGVKEFRVHKNNQFVKTGSNGELLVRRYYVKDSWMVMRVPVNFSGVYKPDDDVVSMIHNLFDSNCSITGMTGVNFNNVKMIPKNLFSNNVNSRNYHLVMPHVHKMNVNAFDNTQIPSIVIGCEDDDFTKENVIDIPDDNEDKEKSILRLSPDCEITVPDEIRPKYHSHSLWGYYMPKNWIISNVVNGTLLTSNPFGSDDYAMFIGNTGTTTGATHVTIKIKGYNDFEAYILNCGATTDLVCCSLPNGTPSTSSSSAYQIIPGGQSSSLISDLSSYTHVKYSNLGNGFDMNSTITLHFLYVCNSSPSNRQGMKLVIPKAKGKIATF